jgi:hypothetical protein
MTQPTWEIQRLERNTANGFVSAAEWKLTKGEGEAAKTIFGQVTFAGSATTPFSELTQEQVLGWVWQQVDKEQTESAMRTVWINEEIAQGLPWGNKE